MSVHPRRRVPGRVGAMGTDREPEGQGTRSLQGSPTASTSRPFPEAGQVCRRRGWPSSLTPLGRTSLARFRCGLRAGGGRVGGPRIRAGGLPRPPTDSGWRPPPMCRLGRAGRLVSDSPFACPGSAPHAVRILWGSVMQTSTLNTCDVQIWLCSEHESAAMHFRKLQFSAKHRNVRN